MAKYNEKKDIKLSNDGRRLVLRYSVSGIGTNASYPVGRFSASVADRDTNSTVATKDVNLTSTSRKDAYQIIAEWMEYQSHKFGITYEKLTLEELVARMESPRVRVGVREHTKGPRPLPVSMAPGAATLPPPSDVVAVMAHKNRFRALIKNAYKYFGYDKIKDVIEDGLLTLDNISADERAASKANTELNMTIAKSMFDIHKAVGLDMSDKITDQETLDMYRDLIEKDTGIAAD